MASNYNGLGLQLMTTGEKAGTWGNVTNTTWNEVKDTFGYVSIAMTADRTLTIPDGSTGTYDGRAFIIELTGTLGGTRVLDIAATAGSGSSPGGSENIEKPFIVYDNTTHSGDTLTFKVTGETGFALSEGSTYLCYHNGTDIINTGLLSSVVADTSPQLGGDLDVNSNDIVSTSNGNIDIVPNGTGVARAKDGGGTTAALKIAGKETMWVPATAMYASTTNGAEATQTELTAGYPELKTFDFDTSTAESVQFNVSFPKSWDEGVVTFQTFWSASATDTGTGGFTLAGCSVASDVDYDLAFGTPVANTALAASGTQDDLMVNVVSGDVTIASAAADTNTIFRLVRDTGTDTNTGDLRLVGIKIYFTTNAANDA